MAFLDDKLAGLRIFEWGSGGSTLWFAQRAAWVTSVEHDAEWHNRVKAATWRLTNVHLQHIQLGHNYWEAVHGWTPDDFILIDGRHRKACAEQVKLLSHPPSAILWDDAQRNWYQCGMPFDGYSHLDFVDEEHPRYSRLFVRTDGLLKHWLD